MSADLIRPDFALPVRGAAYQRPSREVVDSFDAISSATACAKLHGLGIRRSYIDGPEPLSLGQRVVGSALTLQFMPQREDMALPQDAAAGVEQEYAGLYADAGLGTTIWSPLASGLLTGKYNDGIAADSRLGQSTLGWLQASVLGEPADDRLGKVRRFTALAAELGESPAQLAVAWCLRNPQVSSVILGASRVSQLEENLRALDVLGRVEEGAWQQIEAIFA